MRTIEAIQHMLQTSGMSASELSRRMGKGRNHWSVTFAKDSVPKTDTTAEAARILGYRLILSGHGEEIELEGGEQDADKDKRATDERGSS